ncbi:MAG TPA: glycosyltransferase 87 family protein [Candidatus Limnocylindria bacterium]|nr:glycosyltransferase 87 family protein [Candidatus Limnocylindria bacterium]
MADTVASDAHVPAGPRYLAALALAVFLLKVGMALFTYGSTDVLIFEADLAKIRQDSGAALYRDGITTRWCGATGQRPCPPFNHPPFMIHALEGWGALSDISGLPLRFWLRFTCAAADVGSLALLLRMLRSRRSDPKTRTALALFAASPIAILISGFHGNTDAILIFFMLLSIWLVESRRAAWLAGAALGMAVNIKILPILLAPAALLALAGTRRRREFGAGAVAVFLAGSLPILAEAPELVITRVFGYGSQAGAWGLSLLALASAKSPHFAWLHDLHAGYGRIVSLCLVLGASFWPRPRPSRNALFMRTGFVMFVFLSLAPGFGVQYLAWLVPWVVALGARPTAMYYVAGSVFLLAYYTAAAGRFPWYLANSLERPAWTALVIFLGLTCWVVVCGIALVYLRALRASRADPA